MHPAVATILIILILLISRQDRLMSGLFLIS